MGKIYVYPADEHGCGHHRAVWPAQALIDAGHNIEIVMPGARAIHLELRGDEVANIRMPADADVVVFQRVTNRYMAKAVSLIRAQGIAVVIDVDDDLASIHPSNPAFHALHPRNEGRVGANGQVSHHSWAHLTEACKAATLVTTSTEALQPRYAAHGRGRVIHNYLADHYYGHQHDDDVTTIGWPAALMSHPTDPDVVGNAVARLVNQHGAQFDVSALPTGVGRAFGLRDDPPGIYGNTELVDWPEVVARIGIGIAPLADTRFNEAKSWLKPLEMSAVGVPWVGSASREYNRLHAAGAGIIAANPKQWFRALKGLLESRDLRTELAGRGREAADMLRLDQNAYRWLEAWEDALAIQRGQLTAVS